MRARQIFTILIAIFACVDIALCAHEQQQQGSFVALPSATTTSGQQPRIDGLVCAALAVPTLCNVNPFCVWVTATQRCIARSSIPSASPSSSPSPSPSPTASAEELLEFLDLFGVFTEIYTGFADLSLILQRIEDRFISLYETLVLYDTIRPDVINAEIADMVFDMLYQVSNTTDSIRNAYIAVNSTEDREWIYNATLELEIDIDDPAANFILEIQRLEMQRRAEDPDPDPGLGKYFTTLIEGLRAIFDKLGIGFRDELQSIKTVLYSLGQTLQNSRPQLKVPPTQKPTLKQLSFMVERLKERSQGSPLIATLNAISNVIGGLPAQ